MKYDGSKLMGIFSNDNELEKYRIGLSKLADSSKSNVKNDDDSDLIDLKFQLIMESENPVKFKEIVMNPKTFETLHAHYRGEAIMKIFTDSQELENFRL